MTLNAVYTGPSTLPDPDIPIVPGLSPDAGSPALAGMIASISRP